MPKGHKGRKFATLHKFGARKRRGKKVSTAATAPVTASEPQPSTSKQTDDEPHTVASEQKIREFLARERKLESDSDSDLSSEMTDVAKSDDPGPYGAQQAPVQGMNMIINLMCLQSLFARCLCPDCKKPSLHVMEGGAGLRSGSACTLEVICSDCGSISSALVDVMVELELTASTFTTDYMEQADIQRVQHATRKSSEKEKKKRKVVETISRRERQEREEREGVVYGAGQF